MTPKNRTGYYGLYGVMQRRNRRRPLPASIWRAYWALQPLRCLLTFHDWYSLAAGECSGCRCGAEMPYPTWMAHEYRWTPWLRPLAGRLRDAEMRAEYFQDRWLHDLIESAEPSGRDPLT